METLVVGNVKRGSREQEPPVFAKKGLLFPQRITQGRKDILDISSGCLQGVGEFPSGVHLPFELSLVCYRFLSETLQLSNSPL
jgi:hypothetical protein